MYELGIVDPKGCGMISQTQAEQGITLRLDLNFFDRPVNCFISVAYVEDSAIPTTTTSTTTTTTTTTPEPTYKLSESYRREIKGRKYSGIPIWTYIDNYQHLISNLQGTHETWNFSEGITLKASLLKWFC